MAYSARLVSSIIADPLRNASAGWRAAFLTDRRAPDRTRGKWRKSIFVGNLDVQTTQKELKKLFEEYGKVEHVNIIRDRESGLPRGVAFVEMTNEDEAAKAIEALNGSILRDRTLSVDYARPKIEPRAG